MLIFLFMILTFITDSILIFLIVLDKIVDCSFLIIIYLVNISARHTLWTVCLFLRFQKFPLSRRIYLHINLPCKCWLSYWSQLIILIADRFSYVIWLRLIAIYFLKIVARANLPKLLSLTIIATLLKSLLAVPSWHYHIVLALYFLLVQCLLLDIF